MKKCSYDGEYDGKTTINILLLLLPFFGIGELIANVYLFINTGFNYWGLLALFLFAFAVLFPMVIQDEEIYTKAMTVVVYVIVPIFMFALYFVMQNERETAVKEAEGRCFYFWNEFERKAKSLFAKEPDKVEFLHKDYCLDLMNGRVNYENLRDISMEGYIYIDGCKFYYDGSRPELLEFDDLKKCLSVSKDKVEISLKKLSRRGLRQFVELSGLSEAFDGFKIKIENCDGDNCLYIERQYENNLCKFGLEPCYVYAYPKKRLIKARINLEEVSPYVAVVNGKKVQVNGEVCEKLKEKYDWGVYKLQY